jgi:hypothetical protein
MELIVILYFLWQPYLIVHSLILAIMRSRTKKEYAETFNYIRHAWKCDGIISAALYAIHLLYFIVDTYKEFGALGDMRWLGGPNATEVCAFDATIIIVNVIIAVYAHCCISIAKAASTKTQNESISIKDDQISTLDTDKDNKTDNMTADYYRQRAIDFYRNAKKLAESKSETNTATEDNVSEREIGYIVAKRTKRIKIARNIAIAVLTSVVSIAFVLREVAPANGEEVHAQLDYEMQVAMSVAIANAVEPIAIYVAYDEGEELSWTAMGIATMRPYVLSAYQSLSEEIQTRNSEVSRKLLLPEDLPDEVFDAMNPSTRMVLSIIVEFVNEY